MKAGDIFDQDIYDAIPEVDKRALSSGTEEAVTYDNKVYVIWKAGDRTGRIYRIIDRPSPEELSTIPSVKDIEDAIDGYLKTMDTYQAEADEWFGRVGALEKEARDIGDEISYAKYSTAPGAEEKKKALEEKKASIVAPWEKAREEFSVRANICEKNRVEAMMLLRRLYQGNQAAIGLETAQYFIPEIFDLVQNIQSLGVMEWLEERAKMRYPRAKINVFIVNIHLPEVTEYYYGSDFVQDNRYRDTKNPVVLTHGTYSNILPDVINLGGIASVDYFHAKGLTKKTGESHFGGGYTGHAVSFKHYPDGNAFISGGWGSQKGFELPILFGISRTKAEELTTHNGTMGGEKVVRAKEGEPGGFVPLKNFSHIFVPFFAVRSTSETLQAHGYGNIKVMPLWFKNNEPVWEVLSVIEPMPGELFGDAPKAALRASPAEKISPQSIERSPRIDRASPGGEEKKFMIDLSTEPPTATQAMRGRKVSGIRDRLLPALSITRIEAIGIRVGDADRARRELAKLRNWTSTTFRDFLFSDHVNSAMEEKSSNSVQKRTELEEKRELRMRQINDFIESDNVLGAFTKLETFLGILGIQLGSTQARLIRGDWEEAQEIFDILTGYKEMQAVREAITLGDAETARELLSELKQTGNAPRELVDQVEWMIEKLRAPPADTKALPSSELKRLVYLFDRDETDAVRYVGEGDYSIVYESRVLPHVVVKREKGLVRYEDEARLMWRAVESAGRENCEVVIRDGYVMIKIPKCAPVGYFNGFIVSEKGRPLEGRANTRDEELALERKAKRVSEELEEYGIRVRDLKPANVGYIGDSAEEENLVLIDFTHVEIIVEEEQVAKMPASPLASPEEMPGVAFTVSPFYEDAVRQLVGHEPHILYDDALGRAFRTVACPFFITEETLQHRDTMQKMGSDIIAFLRKELESDDIEIVLTVKGSVLKGYAREDSDIDRPTIFILRGEEKIQDDPEKWFKIKEKIRSEFIIGPRIVTDASRYPWQNRELFYPALFCSSPDLLEHRRAESIRRIQRSGPQSVKLWSEVQWYFDRYTDFQFDSNNDIEMIRDRPHLMSSLGEHGIDAARDEALLRFVERRREIKRICSLEEMAALYEGIPAGTREAASALAEGAVPQAETEEAPDARDGLALVGRQSPTGETVEERLADYTQWIDDFEASGSGNPADFVRRIRARQLFPDEEKVLERLAKKPQKYAKYADAVRYLKVAPTGILSLELEDCTVEQGMFEEVDMDSMMLPVYEAVINGTRYLVGGRRWYIKVTLKNGEKIYWSGPHNHMYSFCFDAYTKEELSKKLRKNAKKPPVVHIDYHDDLEKPDSGILAPTNRHSRETHIAFGAKKLDIADFLIALLNVGYMEKIIGVQDRERWPDWDKDPRVTWKSLEDLETESTDAEVCGCDLDVVMDSKGMYEYERVLRSGNRYSSHLLNVMRRMKVTMLFTTGYLTTDGLPRIINPDGTYVLAAKILYKLVKIKNAQIAMPSRPETAQEKITVQEKIAELLYGGDRDLAYVAERLMEEREIKRGDLPSPKEARPSVVAQGKTRFEDLREYLSEHNEKGTVDRFIKILKQGGAIALKIGKRDKYPFGEAPKDADRYVTLMRADNLPIRKISVDDQVTVKADLEILSRLPDGSLDYVLSSAPADNFGISILEKFRDPSVARKLKPGGKVMVKPSYRSNASVYKDAVRLLSDRFDCHQGEAKFLEVEDKLWVALGYPGLPDNVLTLTGISSHVPVERINLLTPHVRVPAPVFMAEVVEEQAAAVRASPSGEESHQSPVASRQSPTGVKGEIPMTDDGRTPRASPSGEEAVADAPDWGAIEPVLRAGIEIVTRIPFKDLGNELADGDIMWYNDSFYSKDIELLSRRSDSERIKKIDISDLEKGYRPKNWVPTESVIIIETNKEENPYRLFAYDMGGCSGVALRGRKNGKDVLIFFHMSTSQVGLLDRVVDEALKMGITDISGILFTRQDVELGFGIMGRVRAINLKGNLDLKIRTRPYVSGMVRAINSKKNLDLKRPYVLPGNIDIIVTREGILTVLYGTKVEQDKHVDQPISLEVYLWPELARDIDPNKNPVNLLDLLKGEEEESARSIIERLLPIIIGLKVDGSSDADKAPGSGTRESPSGFGEFRSDSRASPAGVSIDLNPFVSDRAPISIEPAVINAMADLISRGHQKQEHGLLLFGKNGSITEYEEIPAGEERIIKLRTHDFDIDGERRSQRIVRAKLQEGLEFFGYFHNHATTEDAKKSDRPMKIEDIVPSIADRISFHLAHGKVDESYYTDEEIREFIWERDLNEQLQKDRKLLEIIGGIITDDEGKEKIAIGAHEMFQHPEEGAGWYNFQTVPIALRASPAAEAPLDRRSPAVEKFDIDRLIEEAMSITEGEEWKREAGITGEDYFVNQSFNIKRKVEDLEKDKIVYQEKGRLLILREKNNFLRYYIPGRKTNAALLSIKLGNDSKPVQIYLGGSSDEISMWLAEGEVPLAHFIKTKGNLPEATEYAKNRISKIKTYVEKVKSMLSQSSGKRRETMVAFEEPDAIDVWQLQAGITRFKEGMPRYLETNGAGRCVIVSIYDKESKTGALMHSDSPTLIEPSLNLMLSFMGSQKRENLEVRIIGGYVKSEIERVAEIMMEVENLGMQVVEISMKSGSTGSDNIILDSATGEVYDMIGFPRKHPEQDAYYSALAMDLNESGASIIQKGSAKFEEVPETPVRRSPTGVEHRTPKTVHPKPSSSRASPSATGEPADRQTGELDTRASPTGRVILDPGSTTFIEMHNSLGYGVNADLLRAEEIQVRNELIVSYAGEYTGDRPFYESNNGVIGEEMCETLPIDSKTNHFTAVMNGEMYRGCVLDGFQSIAAWQYRKKWLSASYHFVGDKLKTSGQDAAEIFRSFTPENVQKKFTSSETPVNAYHYSVLKGIGFKGDQIAIYLNNRLLVPAAKDGPRVTIYYWTTTKEFKEGTAQEQDDSIDGERRASPSATGRPADRQTGELDTRASPTAGEGDSTQRSRQHLRGLLFDEFPHILDLLDEAQIIKATKALQVSLTRDSHKSDQDIMQIQHLKEWVTIEVSSTQPRIIFRNAASQVPFYTADRIQAGISVLFDDDAGIGEGRGADLIDITHGRRDVLFFTMTPTTEDGIPVGGTSGRFNIQDADWIPFVPQALRAIARLESAGLSFGEDSQEMRYSILVFALAANHNNPSRAMGAIEDIARRLADNETFFTEPGPEGEEVRVDLEYILARQEHDPGVARALFHSAINVMAREERPQVEEREPASATIFAEMRGPVGNEQLGILAGALRLRGVTKRQWSEITAALTWMNGSAKYDQVYSDRLDEWFRDFNFRNADDNALKEIADLKEALLAVYYNENGHARIFETADEASTWVAALLPQGEEPPLTFRDKRAFNDWVAKFYRDCSEGTDGQRMARIGQYRAPTDDELKTKQVFEEQINRLRKAIQAQRLDQILEVLREIASTTYHDSSIYGGINKSPNEAAQGVLDILERAKTSGDIDWGELNERIFGDTLPLEARKAEVPVAEPIPGLSGMRFDTGDRSNIQIDRAPLTRLNRPLLIPFVDQIRKGEDYCGTVADVLETFTDAEAFALLAKIEALAKVRGNVSHISATARRDKLFENGASIKEAAILSVILAPSSVGDSSWTLQRDIDTVKRYLVGRLTQAEKEEYLETFSDQKRMATGVGMSIDQDILDRLREEETRVGRGYRGTGISSIHTYGEHNRIKKDKLEIYIDSVVDQQGQTEYFLCMRTSGGYSQLIIDHVSLGRDQAIAERTFSTFNSTDGVAVLLESDNVGETVRDQSGSERLIIPELVAFEMSGDEAGQLADVLRSEKAFSFREQTILDDLEQAFQEMGYKETVYWLQYEGLGGPAPQEEGGWPVITKVMERTKRDERLRETAIQYVKHLVKTSPEAPRASPTGVGHRTPETEYRKPSPPRASPSGELPETPPDVIAPQSGQMDVTDRYGLSVSAVDRALEESEIIELLLKKAVELGEEKDEFDGSKTKITQFWMQNNFEKTTNMIKIAARYFACQIADLTRDKDRSFVYFARDMALADYTHATYEKLLGSENIASRGALYLNTTMMGESWNSNSLYAHFARKYDDWASTRTEELKREETDYEYLKEQSFVWFKYMMGHFPDSEFAAMSQEIYDSLKKMGTLEKEKVSLFDSMYRGTMPYFVSAVIRYFDERRGYLDEHGGKPREVEIILVKSRYPSVTPILRSDLSEEELDFIRGGEESEQLTHFEFDPAQYIGQVFESTGGPSLRKGTCQPIWYDKETRQVRRSHPDDQLKAYLISLLFQNEVYRYAEMVSSSKEDSQKAEESPGAPRASPTVEAAPVMPEALRDAKVILELEAMLAEKGVSPEKIQWVREVLRTANTLNPAKLVLNAVRDP
ncbi:MAG: hypothetical protein ABIJ27_01040, partial [Candidatus Omnitrophota bacterium]